MKKFKQFFCKHNNIVFVRNVYGKKTKIIPYKAEWKCKECGKILHSDYSNLIY